MLAVYCLSKGLQINIGFLGMLKNSRFNLNSIYLLRYHENVSVVPSQIALFFGYPF